MIFDLIFTVGADIVALSQINRDRLLLAWLDGHKFPKSISRVQHPSGILQTSAIPVHVEQGAYEVSIRRQIPDWQKPGHRPLIGQRYTDNDVICVRLDK